MFSFNKLLVLVGILAAVWYAFKLIGKMDRDRKASGQAPRSRARRKARREEAVSESPADTGSVEMVQCPGCGTYIPAGKKHCGRPDCSYS